MFLQIQMNSETKRKLAALAKAADCSMGAVIRRLVIAEYKKTKPETEPEETEPEEAENER